MVKILSQAGMSLADTYNVRGSIIGIEELEAREISVVHEMGATIFSERYSGFIRRAVTGALLQNATFDVVLTDLPSVPFRVFNVVVFADVGARMDRAMVALRDGRAGVDREMPIFHWNVANDAAQSIRIADGGAAANKVILIGHDTSPSMGLGSGQPQSIGDLAFRGLTSGFGAGDVTVTALLYIGFSQLGGISSHGLPVPGW